MLPDWKASFSAEGAGGVRPSIPESAARLTGERQPESCPPPLRCRAVWESVQSEAQSWRVTGPRGATLSGWVYGAGPTLLLVSPLGGASPLWSLLAYLLRDDVQCVTWDWTSVGDNRSLSHYADDLLAVTQTLDASPCAVYGVALGGAIALQAARAFPDSIALALIQDGFSQRRLTLAERLLAQLGAWSRRPLSRTPGWEHVQTLNHRRWFPPLDPDRWGFFLEATGRLPLSIVARQALACRRFDIREELPRIETPVWCVSTEGAGPRAKRNAEALMAGLRSAQLESVHTTGYHFGLTHPHRLAKLVRQALGMQTSPAVAVTDGGCCEGQADPDASVSSPRP